MVSLASPRVRHRQPQGPRTPSLASLRGSCLGFEFAGSAWSLPVSTAGPQTKVALRAVFGLAWSRSLPGLDVEGRWSCLPRTGLGMAGYTAIARRPWQAFAAPALVYGRGTGALSSTHTSRRAPPVALRALFWLAGWWSAPFLATRGWVPAGGSAPAGALGWPGLRVVERVRLASWVMARSGRGRAR